MKGKHNDSASDSQSQNAEPTTLQNEIINVNFNNTNDNSMAVISSQPSRSNKNIDETVRNSREFLKPTDEGALATDTSKTSRRRKSPSKLKQPKGRNGLLIMGSSRKKNKSIG